MAEQDNKFQMLAEINEKMKADFEKIIQEKNDQISEKGLLIFI